MIFRWFKFTLKLPHIVIHGNLWLAIGTLLLRIFWSNLDTWHLEIYPRTYYGHFWHLFIFDGSRAMIFRKWVPSMIFRWFKLTLKPPIAVAHDKLRLAIWDTSFWTFFVKFGHRTYVRTYYGHFWHLSIFGGSRAVWVFFRKWVFSENQRYLDNGAPSPAYSVLGQGRQMIGLQDRVFFFGLRHTYGVTPGRRIWRFNFWHIRGSIKGS